MKTQVDDQILSQYYPGIYTHLIPEQGEVAKPPRRMRKKKKGDEANRSGFQKTKLREEQVNILEQSFANEHKLETERKDRLASELGLHPRQVAVWFQNRRARWKSKKLEEEFSKLKNEHDTIVVEKCRLESEVLKLKEQLNDAENEMQRLLTERSDRISSNSPSSTFSTDPHLLGEFGMQGLENVAYLPENDYIHDLEWISMI